ncbi:hypothetical protein ATO11_03655 [Pseudaestuariivita atlantica]|uniref:Uncharacterized protein n=2 Tax=Pseudaestuariivita atlantica TaxID=1317121 RepID=A0A0L1JS17_9RHOB|nr:hypothetical protein ATO11_03655 [Pseudaestuariivita atlantica]
MSGFVPIAIAAAVVAVVGVGATLLFSEGSTVQSAIGHEEEAGMVQRPTGAGSVPDGLAGPAQGAAPRVIDEGDVIVGSADATDLDTVTGNEGPSRETQSRKQPDEANTAPGAGSIDAETGMVTTGSN